MDSCSNRLSELFDNDSVIKIKIKIKNNQEQIIRLTLSGLDRNMVLARSKPRSTQVDEFESAHLLIPVPLSRMKTAIPGQIGS